MLYELFVKGIIVLLVLNALIFPLLGMVSLFVRFVTREDYIPTYGYDYQSLKWGSRCDAGEYIMFDCMFGLFILILLTASSQEFTYETVGCFIIWGTITILSVLYIPRWVYDICKGLKYRSKTGKLEEIERLKARLDKLERK